MNVMAHDLCGKERFNVLSMLEESTKEFEKLEVEVLTSDLVSSTIYNITFHPKLIEI